MHNQENAIWKLSTLRQDVGEPRGRTWLHIWRKDGRLLMAWEYQDATMSEMLKLFAPAWGN